MNWLDISHLSVSSRRDFLAGSAAFAGLLTAIPAFAQRDNLIATFAYRAPQSALDDLKQRLSRTRWPEAETGPGWSQGVPLAKMRALVDYWRDGYDWRRCEAALNRIPQFRTDIDGLGIHFIHARSKHANALPIVMTHGWPGSVIEFMEVVAPLTDPVAHGGRVEDAFHVVAPSLPGFGFSDKPSAKGWNADQIAKAWGVLMGRLGYTRYIAQGGDWGTFVTMRMAQLRVPGVAAIHITMPQVIPDQLPAKLTAPQQRAIDAQKRFETDGSGYFALQSTRPQTIGYALADSPAGQAAWIYEKFYAWTDNNGKPEDALTPDQMLDNITLYWLTDTAASSARIYAEHAGIGASKNAGVVDLPVGLKKQRMVFGANTYRVFAKMVASSTKESDVHDPWVTRMRNLPATVVSTTLKGPLDWPDATLVSGDAVDVVARLKEESEVPLRSHGSLSMNRALMAAGLVDRVQVTLFPVITGQTGEEPIFHDAADFDLELIESRLLDGHTQELIYLPTRHV